jgi:pilus assembly protein Flp/PilA
VRTLFLRVNNFLKREDGPTAVEYAVMLVLVVVACVAAITTLGQNANGAFNNADAPLSTPALPHHHHHHHHYGP